MIKGQAVSSCWICYRCGDHTVVVYSICNSWISLMLDIKKALALMALLQKYIVDMTLCSSFTTPKY